MANENTANIQMGRIYSPKTDNKGTRDVLYPETNIDSIVTRYSTEAATKGQPITLADDIGPKIAFTEPTNNEDPKNTGREALWIRTLVDGVANIDPRKINI